MRQLAFPLGQRVIFEKETRSGSTRAPQREYPQTSLSAYFQAFSPKFQIAMSALAGSLLFAAWIPSDRRPDLRPLRSP